jgi:hypothetical protein
LPAGCAKWSPAPHGLPKRCELGGTSPDARQAEEQISAALVRRLERNKFKHESGSPNYFRLRFSESEEETLPIYERQSPFDFRGRKTDQTATEAKGSLIVEFYGEGKKEPLWREVFNGASSRSFHE